MTDRPRISDGKGSGPEIADRDSRRRFTVGLLERRPEPLEEAGLDDERHVLEPEMCLGSLSTMYFPLSSCGSLSSGE